MKWKFTHKEFTLLLGILVAIIIMITLWLKPFSLESGEASKKPAQKLITPAAKIMAKKTYMLVTEILNN